MVDHVYVKFSDLSCMGFWGIVWKNRQKDRQTNRQTLKRPEQTTHVTAVSFGKYLWTETEV